MTGFYRHQRGRAIYTCQNLHLHKDMQQDHAFKFSSKMLADEIMDQIEMKNGVPKKQQRPRWNRNATNNSKNDMERLAMQNHETVMTLANQNHDRKRGNTERHFVYDALRKRCTIRESRNKDRRKHERT